MNPAKFVSIEQCYINLSIVETKEQRQKEKQLQATQHAAAVVGTYEEIYAVKTPVDVKDIFKTCKKPEKQVLVFGRAGIGKSTFCQYIAYQWATGSYWPQYELLALIPLRRLTADRYPPGKEYSLIDLVKIELFPLDLSTKEEEELIKQFDAKKTLWILDGHDEIAQSKPPHLQRLYEQLLKTPHHIITSRPYLNTLSREAQMEIIGFTSENIRKYVYNFFDQMKDELEDAPMQSERLLNLLQSTGSIWGVAHIPVNLELICSIWGNEDWSETQQLTITKLYMMMTEWLCRRYLTAQGVAMQQMCTSEMYGRCEEELRFIETLAFRGMESNTILLRPNLLETARKESKISWPEYSRTVNIGILKSIDRQATGTQIEMDKDHYFVHLSFQEYFAARHLMHTLKRCQNEQGIQFIRQNKYNQRYTLLFAFTAGLLSDDNERSHLHLFWNTLIESPVDLLAIRHIQLVIACMDETNNTTMLSRRSTLLLWILKCLKIAFDADNSIILNHLLQSLRRAQFIVCNREVTNFFIRSLQSRGLRTKTEVLSFIKGLDINNPTHELISSVISMLDDQNEKVRSSACSALGKIGEKAATNEVISELVSALEDQNEWVRRSACFALAKIGEKAATNEVLSKLVSALDDQNEQVRNNAYEVLAKIGEKAATNEVINKLLSFIHISKLNMLYFSNAIQTILSSPKVMKLVDPKLIGEVFLNNGACNRFKNVSKQHLIAIFSETKNLGWLFVVTQFALQNGTTIIAFDDKFVLYGKMKPYECLRGSPDVRKQLAEAFIDERKRLQLHFVMRQEDHEQ